MDEKLGTSMKSRRFDMKKRLWYVSFVIQHRWVE